MPASWTRKSSEERRRLAGELVLSLLPEDGSEVQWSTLKKEVKKRNVSTATLSTHLKEYTNWGIVDRRADTSLYPPRVYYSRIPTAERTDQAEATTIHSQEKVDMIHSLGVDLDKYVFAVTRNTLTHIMMVATICLSGYLRRLSSFRYDLLDPIFLQNERELLRSERVRSEVIVKFLTSHGIDLQEMTKSIRNDDRGSVAHEDKVTSFLRSHGVDPGKIDALMRSEGLDDERTIELAISCYAKVVDHYIDSMRRDLIELVDFHSLLDPRNGKPFLYNSRVEKNFKTIMLASREIGYEDFRFLENLEKKLGWAPAEAGGSNYPWEKKQAKKRKAMTFNT